MGGPPAVDAAAVAARVAEVRERIARAGGARRTRLVAVTKGFGPDALVAAAAAGADAVGENYAQETVAKLAALDEPLTCPLHFIGQLQRNKVRALAPHVALWQSVDRVEIGREIAQRRPGASVLVQMNLSGEPGRGGVVDDDVEATVVALVALGLDVRGLMGVAPIGPPEVARAAFGRLARRADALGLAERSMGMSEDLEIAVELGATLVRIGRALFGERPPRT